jgi:hypothetical protein
MLASPPLFTFGELRWINPPNNAAGEIQSSPGSFDFAQDKFIKADSLKESAFSFIINHQRKVGG